LWLALANRNQNVQAQVAAAETQTDPNHPVEVYFGDPQYRDLQSMADSLTVTIYPEDKVETLPPPGMGLGSKIVITRATKVNVTDAKVKKVYRTWQGTIGDLLKEKNIELLGKDSSTPGLSAPLYYNMAVNITRVAEVEEKETENIDYKVIKKYSADLEKGDSQIEQKGVNGTKEVTYIVYRVDGVEISRSVKDTNVTKDSVSEILIIGIGPKLAHSGPYLDTINNAAKTYLINGTALMCLMLNESGGSADAGYPDGQYKGLFQYTDGFWADASSKAGYGGASIYDAGAQIYTTAWALTHGYGGRWPTWSYCSGK
jgi:hypothetical protein